jgi:hypothetical protein
MASEFAGFGLILLGLELQALRAPSLSPSSGSATPLP